MQGDAGSDACPRNIPQIAPGCIFADLWAIATWRDKWIKMCPLLRGQTLQQQSTQDPKTPVCDPWGCQGEGSLGGWQLLGSTSRWDLCQQVAGAIEGWARPSGSGN